jgi:hypothetical protein
VGAAVKCKLHGGAEVDAIEGKSYLKFRAGVRKWIKRKINKRLRRINRAICFQELNDA